jgi:hypothetical protein
LCEWEVRDWLAAGRPRTRPARRSASVDEDLLDREFAQLMLDIPSHYPHVRGWSLEAVARLVRNQRLNPQK